MEDLDISNKLRGYDFNELVKNMKNYYDMLSAVDEETQLLGASLMLNDSSFFNFLSARYGEGTKAYFKINLDFIFDSDKLTIKHLYITRILATLSRILHGHNPFYRYG